MIKLANAFALGVLLMIGTTIYDDHYPRPKFNLDMTPKQVRELCPQPLIPVFENYHKDEWFACDDGKKVTVVMFEKDKLAAILDLRWAANYFQPLMTTK